MKPEDMNGDFTFVIWLFLAVLLAGAVNIAQYLGIKFREERQDRRERARMLREKKEREIFDDLVHRKR